MFTTLPFFSRRRRKRGLEFDHSGVARGSVVILWSFTYLGIPGCSFLSLSFPDGAFFFERLDHVERVTNRQTRGRNIYVDIRMANEVVSRASWHAGRLYFARSRKDGKKLRELELNPPIFVRGKAFQRRLLLFFRVMDGFSSGLFRCNVDDFTQAVSRVSRIKTCHSAST